MDVSNKLVKVIYEDAGKTKVIRGYVIKEEEFTYTVKTERDSSIIIVGKRSLINLMVVPQ